MKSTFRLLSLLTFIYCYAPAQNRFIKEIKFPQKVTIADGSFSSPNVSVYMLKLAEGNGKSVRSTSFTIEFEQLLRINTREVNFVYSISSGALQLKGDIAYRKFDMSDELIPSALNYRLRLKKSNGNFRDIDLEVSIENGKPENGSYNFTDSINDYTSTDIVNHVFRFGSSNNFENKIRLINQYYQQIEKLDQSYLLLQSVLPAQFDNFRNNQRNLVLAGNTLRETEDMNFGGKLPLAGNDPGRLTEKMNVFRNLLRQKEAEMQEILQTLHFTFYERGINQLHRNNIYKAREYFLWSLEVNPLFAPALLQLAIIDFKSGDLHETMCKSDDILFHLPADPETVNLTYLLLQDVYNSYLENGNRETRRGNYPKALDEFESAKRICKKYVQVRCTEGLQQGFISAKKGIYNDYLSEAKDYIILNDFNRAELSTQEAIRYQQENKTELKEAPEALQILKDIRQKRYDQMVIKANRLTDQKMYEEALACFQLADSLSQSQQLLEVKDVYKMTLAAARPRIIELLYEGENHVTHNNLNEARSCFRKSSDLQSKYRLTDDKDIRKHTQSLRNNIFTQQCLIVQNFADSCYNTGQFLEADASYIEAGQAYAAGMEEIRKFPDCGISADSLESAALNIRNAVTFLELLQQVKNDQLQGSYQSAIDHFQKASAYHQNMNVQRFGIAHDPDIYRYIREKGSAGLINYSGDWYREKGELENSLSMYKLLLDRNYDFRLLSGALYKLGQRFGQKDKKLNPGSSWKDLVKEYTGGDKKLKRFSRGYKSGFKG